MFNWLMNHVFDRKRHRQFQAECRRLDAWGPALAELDARIAKLYTPEEWAALAERCERKIDPYNMRPF